MANLANAVPVPPQPLVTNDQLRALLLGTATRRSQAIATQIYTPGSPMIFQVPNVSLPYKIRMFIGGTVTAVTNNATPGYRWPHSLFNRLTLTDYLGTQRIAVRPYALHKMRYYKRQGLQFPYNGQATIEPNATDTGATAALVTNPLPGTAGAFVAGVAKNVAWSWDIPISYSPTDLRGIFRCDVAGAVTTIQLDPCTTLVQSAADADVPFIQTSGGITVSALQVWFVVYFYDPVVVSVPNNQGGASSIVPYPTQDMSVVHELLSLDLPGTMFTAGSEALYQLPTGREYYAMLTSVNNRTSTGMAQQLITRLRFLVEGSNNVALDEYLQPYLARTNEQWSYLPDDSDFWWNWHDRPWDSNRYGQLQLGWTVAGGAVFNSGSRMEMMRESMYTLAQQAA